MPIWKMMPTIATAITRKKAGPCERCGDTPATTRLAPASDESTINAQLKSKSVRTTPTMPPMRTMIHVGVSAATPSARMKRRATPPPATKPIAPMTKA